jgi:hypothetical protein
MREMVLGPSTLLPGDKRKVQCNMVKLLRKPFAFARRGGSTLSWGLLLRLLRYSLYSCSLVAFLKVLWFPASLILVL